MIMNKGKLTLLCGKMGAGKSTHARKMAKDKSAVLLSEDEWLAAFYPNKINSLDDYLNYSKLLKPQVKKLVQSVLLAGVNVVLDFPANTVSQRQWLRGIFAEIDAPHSLVFLDVSDELCLQRVAKRAIEQPQRAVTDTDAMFEAITQHFVPPSVDEGFNVVQFPESQQQSNG